MPPASETADSSHPAAQRSHKRRWIALWLVILPALAIAIENWTGHRAWNATVAELSAKGERLDAAAAIPPPIPDERNFAASPLFTPLFDYTIEDYSDGSRPAYRAVWRDPAAADELKNLTIVRKPPPWRETWREGKQIDLTAWQKEFRKQPDFPVSPDPKTPAEDVLLGLSKFDAKVQELRKLSGRPECRFPLHYEDGLRMEHPHLALVQRLSTLAVLRSVSELALQRPQDALEDELLALRLAETLSGNPSVLSCLLRTSLTTVAIQPLWEGLARHQWSEQQLTAIDQRLERINLVDDFGRGIRAERNLFSLRVLDHIPVTNPLDGSIYSSLPFLLSAAATTGWREHSNVATALVFQEILACSDPAAVRVFPDRFAACEKNVEKLLGVQWNPHTLLARTILPMNGLYVQRCADAQAGMHLARIAIALERHRLQHGEYPGTLEAVDPAVRPSGASGFPVDVASGNPAHYRHESGDRYTLYYDGWNCSDDGGRPAWKATGPKRRDPTQGDWVWPQREP